MLTFGSLLVVAAVSLPPCPNLTGVYVVPSEDGAVRVTITQQGCDRVDVEWFTAGEMGSSRDQHHLRADGVFRETQNWGGGSGAATSARFVDERLELITRRTTGDSSLTARSAFALLPDRDLCWVLEGRGRASWPPRAGSLAVRTDSTADADARERLKHLGTPAGCSWPGAHAPIQLARPNRVP